MPVSSYSGDNLTLAESIALMRHSEDPSNQVTDAMNAVADRAFEQHEFTRLKAVSLGAIRAEHGILL